MHTLRDVPPLELGRSLMRGDRAKFKQGYSHENAAKAVLEIHGEREPAEWPAGVRAHLRGFEDGMLRRERQASSIDYLRGYELGLGEPAEATLPAGG